MTIGTFVKIGEKQLPYILKKILYPDLILLDIDMPQMDGIDTVKRVMELINNRILIMFCLLRCAIPRHHGMQGNCLWQAML